MKTWLLLIFLLVASSAVGQYRLYEEGIKKYNEKDYYAAIELFSDFLTKPLHDKKFDADTYYWRGLSAFRLNDFEAAVEDLKQSAALNHPNAANIHWFLAKSQDNLTKYDDAVVSYGNAIRLLEKDKAKKVQLLSERSQVYSKMNKPVEAVHDLQAASVLAPDNIAIQDEITRLTNGRTVQITPNTTAKTETKKDPVTKTPNTPQGTPKKEEKKQEIAKTETSKTEIPQWQKDLDAGTSDKTNSVASNTLKTETKTEKKEEKKEEKQQPLAKNQPGKNTVQPPKQESVPVTTSTPTVAEPKEPTLAELYKDEKRYALIIGNSAYPKQIGVLKNPVNDATDFAVSIKNLGFEVTLITNASYGKIRAEMMKFRDKLNEGEKDKTIGLFYYAGHGLQSDNENYIVPVDAELQFQDDIARYCFPIQKMVLSQMENTNSRMNIVILDACRNNPFPSLSRGIGEAQGLGELKKARGAFIAYATSPGSVASDGTGRNGLYTQELIKAMNKPGKTIEQVFKEVRANVLKVSGDRQNPWENSNIIGDFYFKFE